MTSELGASTNYNQRLAEHLHEKFGISKEESTAILDFISEFSLYQMVFSGPINTPFGRLGVVPCGVQVLEQNESLIHILKAERSKSGAKSAIQAMLQAEVSPEEVCTRTNAQKEIRAQRQNKKQCQ